MSAQCCQTALESAADGVEFPFSVVLVQLAYHNGCLNGEILSEVKMDQFFSGCIIHNTNKCVGYLSEILSSDICIVDRHGKCDTFDVGWNLCQIDHV